MLWYQTRDVRSVLALRDLRAVCLDTETTGFSPDDGDEILQISLVGTRGEVLYDGLFKPAVKASWPRAEAVNHISPRMVAAKPSVQEARGEIGALLSSAEAIVTFNGAFDEKFLLAAGIELPDVPRFDVMREYAPLHGEWSPRYREWRYPRLQACADHYGVAFAAHDALEDSRATMACFRAMLDDDAPGGYLDLVARGGRSVNATWPD